MELTRMCMVPGKAIVCMAPTFTAVTDDMATYEPAFKRVYLRPEDNYAFDAQALIDAIEENPGAYVYVDNPNNPTGQVFPLEDVRRVVQAARDAGSFIIRDEAWRLHARRPIGSILYPSSTTLPWCAPSRKGGAWRASGLATRWLSRRWRQPCTR